MKQPNDLSDKDVKAAYATAISAAYYTVTGDLKTAREATVNLAAMLAAFARDREFIGGVYHSLRDEKATAHALLGRALDRYFGKAKTLVATVYPDVARAYAEVTD